MPPDVDTQITVISNWTTPDSRHEIFSQENDTRLNLDIQSVETANTGDYICTARVIDSSNSEYVTDSELGRDTVHITVSK